MPTTIYAEGPLAMSVCSDDSVEDMLDVINSRNPTGISSPWVLSKDTHFRSGEPHPCPCNHGLGTHYLLEC